MSHRPLGPGPGAYMLPSCFGYAKCDSRTPRSPQYSFGSRSRSCNRPNRASVGPGPAAYHLGSVTRYGKANNLEYAYIHRRGLDNNNKPKSVR
ncbi:LOW QUALITY PROTEIN: outer dense fiber protein 3B [Drosophila obscura]|uniref:LOW QUALITY PROTEIN: outer dense fiber protein 3B n=1 Tax=Drosophila obscura TaxID=7282 RepID=UPI000BA13FCA|nr:LOW QUALITY PROTEIN: outer dense fiber protein 3B [Drosophila obscura]